MNAANFTNSTMSTNCTDINAPSELSFMTASLSLLFFLVIVSGNLLIVLAIIKNPCGDLNKPFISLVGQLALADLIVGLVVTPISLILHIKEGMHIAFGVLWLQVLHLSYFISCTASLLSITAIAIDRFIAIAYPMHYKAIYLNRKPIRSYTFIWIFAFGLPFIYLKVGYIRYAFVFGNIAIISTMLFLFSSLFIIRKLSQRNKNPNVKTDNNSEGVERRLTKVFSLILTAYLTCYVPSCFMIYLMNLCVTCSCTTIHWLRDMQFVLILLNSCVNPILYAWQIKAFRNAFKLIVCSLFKRKTSTMTFSLPKSDRSESSERDNKPIEIGFVNVGIEETNL